jgi:hypothetical protein
MSFSISQELQKKDEDSKFQSQDADMSEEQRLFSLHCGANQTLDQDIDICGSVYKCLKR